MKYINELIKFKHEIIEALFETLTMVGIASIAAAVFGIFLGSVLYYFRRGGIRENKYVFAVANTFVNVVRSVPFILFVFVLTPVTRAIYGSAFGVIPASFPLCITGSAIYARFVEQTFNDIDPGIIECAEYLGASDFQIIIKFLLVEGRSSLILGMSSTIISIISYSTVMGMIGGGGVGAFAIVYGYQQYDYTLMYSVIAVMIALVLLIQSFGNRLAFIFNKRR